MEKTNRLSRASSPYLKQHANNPVDWYEWGEEALTKARTENKPIIISVGYAACHWCHVMAHESFSDQNLADYMNKHFVCIKVDREERPDIDRIYIEAAQLITGRGGWPLNAFALPDGRPFYAGTYFSPAQWMDVLVQLNELYLTDHSRIQKAAGSITEGMATDAYLSTWDDSPILAEEYQTAFQNHIKNIDFDLGGTLGAPKFMMPVGMEFLLQYYYFTHDVLALDAVNITLGAMAKGGIYDQIGGGFARYSTDQYWKVPHFEKMLYDNAQLISLYAHAHQVTGNSLYADIIEHTIAFAERELLDACGGFYASIDADSEHEEGKFYVWTKAEVEAVLDPKTAEIVLAFYQITDDGNWEHGKNILHYNTSKTVFAAVYHLSESELNFILKKANHLLLAAREKRIRPTTDDKILTSWNALMVSAYVSAYKALGKDHYLEGAIRTARFLEQNLMTETALLYRVYKDGKVSVDAFLDDYALLAQAFIDLYEATFDVRWLRLSNGLAEYACRHFDDESNALFYYTSDHSEQLIVRKHEVSDNVIPAANSVFAHVLLRLSQLFENEEFGEISEAMLSQVKESAMQQGVYFANWASLMGRHLYPKREVAIVGVNASSMALELQRNYQPDTVFAGGEVADLPLLKDRFVTGKTLIYVCENRMCNAPVDSVEEALALLRKG